MKSRHQHEQGSVALTLTWFMLIALLLAIGLDSFLGIYIARQQGETASVAAVLAVTAELGVYLPEAIRAEAEVRVNTILRDPLAVDALRDYSDELDAREQECRATPWCVPNTDEETARLLRLRRMQEYQAAFSRHYRGTLGRSMAELIVDGDWRSSPALALLDELIPDDQELGCLVVRTAQQHQGALLTQAAALAQANQASLDRTRSTVGLSGGRHRVTVRRTVRPFGAEWIFSDGNLPALHSESVAVLNLVGHRIPQYPERC